MSFLKDMLNPPPVTNDAHDYQFNNNQFSALNSLQYLKNPSIVMNANFATLGSNGLTPITQADGDNAEFSADWNVYGAANADYTLTPTPYPANSTVQSASSYYINAMVTSFNNNAFYLYQRVGNTVRQFQKEYFTYGFIFNNNQSKAISMRLDIYSYYDTTSNLVTGKPFWLQPGQNAIPSQLLTQSLSGITVGAGNYTEFRLNFINLVDGTADIDIYQIKCEPGLISTPL